MAVKPIIEVVKDAVKRTKPRLRDSPVYRASHGDGAKGVRDNNGRNTKGRLRAPGVPHGLTGKIISRDA